jgi:uncharacterized protein (DUF1810 family)
VVHLSPDRGSRTKPDVDPVCDRSLGEAKAYLAHPVLGARLRECARLTLDAEGKTARDIFGSIDEMKFRSSMTLFARAALDDDVFQRCIDKYFAGSPDPATLGKV